jgi:membrane protein YqaA with SNARE-associated domain
MASFGVYPADTFDIRLSGEITGCDEKTAAHGVESCRPSEAHRILQGTQGSSSRLSRLHEMVSNLFSFASRFSGLGLFVLTLLDASFLFIPFGPDLLLIALVARAHELAPFFVLIAAAGSVAGCAVIDAVSRKEGEKGLERLLSPCRIRSVAKRVRKSAPWALSIASVMPPPFPFTPIIIAASALQYPRKKLLTVVSIARLARYLIEALLGIYFGRQLMEISRSKGVELVIISLIVISIGGSVVTSYKWIKKKGMKHTKATRSKS